MSSVNSFSVRHLAIAAALITVSHSNVTEDCDGSTRYRSSSGGISSNARLAGLVRIRRAPYIHLMRILPTTLTALALLALPGMAPAHPHVFVDTGLRLIISDDGTLDGIEVSWTYDDFYSLLLFADLGLDPDGDSNLTPDEVRRLDGFDLQWIDGFEGDAYVLRDDVPVTLGAPQSRGVSVKDGLITTTHFRSVGVPADGLVIKAYDPTFYTAYTLVGDVAVDGPCTAEAVKADIDAAYAKAEELLYGGSYDPESDEYPEVGEAFADTVSVSCPN
jgi:ABC-type uncharacterized transport system substrate-binding protein